jgi:hypothetical protein
MVANILLVLFVLILLVLFYILQGKRNSAELELLNSKKVIKSQALIFKSDTDKLKNGLNREISESHRKISVLSKEIEQLKEAIIVKDEFYETLKKEDSQTFVKISSLYSDFLLLQYDISSKYLKEKSRPAIKESLRIDELKSETKAYVQQYRQMFYKYEYLLVIFPELADFVEDIETIKQLNQLEDIKSLEEDFDRTKFFLSSDEYMMLSEDERNQLALDRYVSGQRTKWQIGRDYELYCGIEYEKKGWDVHYFGMEKKLEDMGRDLIAIKNDEHHIIQCKFWSKNKVIHEKHISQLYGTAIMYSLEKANAKKVKAVFVTNIELSQRARSFAEKLGVIVHENFEIKDFPRIKCNVNKDEFGFESRIYHLPFDQQYDKTKINKKSEFFAFTVEQAVKAGFRRAYRYFGS